MHIGILDVFLSEHCAHILGNHYIVYTCRCLLVSCMLDFNCNLNILATEVQ